MKIETINKENLTDRDRTDFGDMLKKQGKVKGDPYSKADRCKVICFAKIDNEIVGIGGLKERTNSAFTKEKANLMEMRQLFNWELGYLYTSENHRGLGVASKIVVKLLNIHGDENLMASTEIEENPGMVKILERHGFEQKGETWKSGIHEDILGLYIKLK
ncbi:MAG: GNAT family N-acetyltransferase [Bacteroidetes bacterium]|nr:GNAT family N-acetyltransferase [Bacteroidota bacterium]